MISISDEAHHGLQVLAKQFGLSNPKYPNVSGLLENIGLFTLSVTDHAENSEGFVDEYGLSELLAYQIGIQDAEQQKTPQFLERFGKRERILVRAYMKGYGSLYIDGASL